MGTDKRERQKANRQARVHAQEVAEARRRRLRFARNAVILVLAIVVVGLLLAGCGSGSNGTGAVDGTKTTNEVTGADDAKPGTGPCPPAGGAAKPVTRFSASPKMCIDPAKAYTAEVETTEGTVTVALDTERTPITTNNFVVLARYGYYDGTDLFRTEATSGIVQGGSPNTQDGSDDGPGYNIPDEAIPFSADDYGPGTLAMARQSLPDSGGAQFFFLANENGRYLGDPAQVGPDSAGTYVVFGKVTKGLDVLVKIAALDDGTGTPTKQVTIKKVTITEA
jgi:cyclophilin family peptidyl-prolyl cis-trans isomerase